MAYKNPLLSTVITSYTMERFKDICELFDSIRTQSIVKSRESVVPLPTSQNADSRPSTNDYQTLEVIFVAEHSGGLYEKVRKRFLFERKVKQGGKGNGFEGSDPEGDREGSRILAKRNPGLCEIFEGKEDGNRDGGYERIFA